jgi:hypothetical protein
MTMQNRKDQESQLKIAPKGFFEGKLISKSLCNEITEYIKFEDDYKWTDPDGTITRKTINYGWDYTALEFGKHIFKTIPPCILKARKAVVDSLKGCLQDDILPDLFDNIIITIYSEGQHLIPHYDADNIPNPITKRNFSFAEPIIGWVIKADTESSMTFYHHEHEGRPEMNSPHIYQADEVDGTTFLIDKECRHFPYFHSIPPVKSIRISMTLRRTILPENYSNK